jgi:octaprenyl-diphosphate synthase
LDLQLITRGIEDKLHTLEEEMIKIITSDIKAMSLIKDPTYLSGGKRIRPVLLFHSAKLCEYEGQKDTLYAVIVELIHNATLIHDDIIDNAKVRRGKPSANYLWGNSLGVLLGDYLYIKAIELAQSDENSDIVRLLCYTTRKMIEGELTQNIQVSDINLTEEDYLDIIKGKTAYLFSACSVIGAILAEASEEIKKSLQQFGYNLGIAFQLIDDMLNFSSRQEIMGKPIGNDLLEGKVTLPIIFLIQRANKKEQKKVEKVLQEKSYNVISMEEIVELLNKYKALQATREKAFLYIEKAKKNLDAFPPCPAQESLMYMADFIVQREK